MPGTNKGWASERCRIVVMWNPRRSQCNQSDFPDTVLHLKYILSPFCQRTPSESLHLPATLIHSNLSSKWGCKTMGNTALSTALSWLVTNLCSSILNLVPLFSLVHLPRGRDFVLRLWFLFWSRYECLYCFHLRNLACKITQIKDKRHVCVCRFLLE